MLRPYEQKPRIKLATTIIAVVAIACLVVVADYVKSQSRAPTRSSTSTSVPTPGSSAPVTNVGGASSYRDGMYSATSSYFVPHSTEQIQVDVTLKSGVVSNVSIRNSESDFDSAQYQEQFAASYKSQVVGRSIKGLQIDVVAGASDTTQGFNDALNQIASQAQS